MSELFLKIVNMSISASWLVPAVLILRLVLKKAPKWVHVLLWGIVAVRLVCPFSIESVLSLIPSAETISPTVITDPVPSIHTGIPAVNSAVNPVIRDTFTPAPGDSANPLQIWIPILSTVWAAGAVLMLAYTVFSYVRLRLRIDTAVRLRDNIFQSEAVGSPFVLGIFRPRIYLPFKIEPQDLEHVVAHETAHIRRRDHWWKPLGFLLLTVHWFNPLMWLAYVLLCRDIELACDEKVIQKLDHAQRADYSQALVSCSVNRRSIAACPIAFGEIGVKDRVRSILHYKKPAFWIILLAIAACIAAAVCFLTDPIGFRFDEDKHSIISAVRFDMRSGGDAGATELNAAQMDELRSRLTDVKNTKRSEKYAGLTPGYQISVRLADDTYIRISGYSLTETDMVDIEWDGERYAVSDADFQAYLSRICAKKDAAAAEEAAKHAVTKWFDYLESPEAMPWDGRLEYTLPEFPDVTFRWTPEKMEAVTEKSTVPIYYGMPIWNTYFCDLTGDGKPELCSSYAFGSGIVSEHILVYDYANRESYELSHRGYYDFTLRFNAADGHLYADVKNYNTQELVQSGRLIFKDGGLHTEGSAPNEEAVTLPPAATLWFDYLETPEEAEEAGYLETTVPEFPGVTFCWDPDKMAAVTENGTTVLYRGMPILSAYFCDFTGDGLPELCSTVDLEPEGVSGNDYCTLVYDYANGTSYSLEDRRTERHSYALRQNESDGLLYVDKAISYGTEDLVLSGILVLHGGRLQILPTGNGAGTQQEPIRAVILNGILYLDSGLESTREDAGKLSDGEITSTVDAADMPTKNGQSNFGTGYKYQFLELEHIVEVMIDGTCRIFEQEHWLSASSSPTASTIYSIEDFFDLPIGRMTLLDLMDRGMEFGSYQTPSLNFSENVYFTEDPNIQICLRDFFYGPEGYPSGVPYVLRYEYTGVIPADYDKGDELVGTYTDDAGLGIHEITEDELDTLVFSRKYTLEDFAWIQPGKTTFEEVCTRTPDEDYFYFEYDHKILYYPAAVPGAYFCVCADAEDRVYRITNGWDYKKDPEAGKIYNEEYEEKISEVMMQYLNDVGIDLDF